MSSAGHVFDAIKRMQFNRALRKIHKARYNKMKDAILKTKSKYHVFVDRNNLSEEELQLYKSKVKNHVAKERRIAFIKSIVITFIIVAIVLNVFRFIYFYLKNSDIPF